LPKTIHRSDSKAAGAILGFAYFLLRIYAEERPRAVVVGWDGLEATTKRREIFPAYQSGREFDDALVEQLGVPPGFVAACGFANTKAPGFEADDFLAAAVAAQERAGGSALVASGDRDSFQLASQNTTILYPLRGGETERITNPPFVSSRPCAGASGLHMSRIACVSASNRIEVRALSERDVG
jgi:DNA polymerase-1